MEKMTVSQFWDQAMIVSEPLELAILKRAIRPSTPSFPPEIAEAILEIELDSKDKARLHQLALQGQKGLLTGEESQELETYRRIGYFLDLLRSKARRSIQLSLSGEA